MHYLQLTISYHYDSVTTELRDEDLSDWLIAELGALGFDSFEQASHELKAFIPTEQYDATATQELLDAFPVLGFTYELTAEKLPDINWNEEWEKNYFQPILLGDGACLIRAPFHEPRPEVPMEIIINPKMAFGTGNHQTTSLVGEWILSHDVHGPLVLDMCCGTIDEMLCGDAALLEGRAGYDLILANITRNILLEDMPRYRAVMLPGARLILSGFYEEDIPLLRARGEELGLSFVSSEVRQRWSRVELLLPA